VIRLDAHELALSPDGKMFAVAAGTAAGDGWIYLFDMQTRKSLGKFHHGAYAAGQLKFTADSRYLFSRLRTGFMGIHYTHLWQVKDGKQLLPHPTEAQLKSLADKDEKKVPDQGNSDGFFILNWVRHAPFRWSSVGDVSPDGRYVVCSGGMLNAVCVYDTVKKKKTFIDTKESAGWLTVSPDGKQVAGFVNLKLHIWSLPEFKKLKALPISVVQGIDEQIVFVPKRKMLLVRDFSSVKLVDIARSKVLRTIDEIDKLESTIVSPDGRFFIIGGKTIEVRRIPSGSLVSRLDHHKNIRSLSMDAKGKWLASLGADSVVRFARFDQIVVNE
jgi:WD40 repeat protein